MSRYRLATGAPSALHSASFRRKSRSITSDIAPPSPSRWALPQPCRSLDLEALQLGRRVEAFETRVDHGSQGKQELAARGDQVIDELRLDLSHGGDGHAEGAERHRAQRKRFRGWGWGRGSNRLRGGSLGAGSCGPGLGHEAPSLSRARARGRARVPGEADLQAVLHEPRVLHLEVLEGLGKHQVALVGPHW